MNTYTLRTYLLILSNPKDAAKLKANLKSALHKLGATAYLASFRAAPEQVYRDMKKRYGIVGEIRWIQFPDDWVTLTR